LMEGTVNVLKEVTIVAKNRYNSDYDAIYCIFPK
jgi:hypothetical protein